MSPLSLLLIQRCLRMAHVNEAVGVESYRLPGDLARVMNIIFFFGATHRYFVRLSSVRSVSSERCGAVQLCPVLSPNGSALHTSSLQDFHICFNPELLRDGRASGFSWPTSQRSTGRSRIYGSDKEESGGIHSMSENGTRLNFWGGFWGVQGKCWRWLEFRSPSYPTCDKKEQWKATHSLSLVTASS